MKHRTSGLKRARAVSRILSIAAAGCLFGASGSATEPTLDPLCSIGNEFFRVELVREGPCCPNRLELLVADHRDDSTRVFEVTTRANHIYRLQILEPSKILATGRFGIGDNALLVLDLTEEEPPDEIHTYGHQLSPSKRWMVYQTHDPEAPAPEERQSILLLYDLQRSPAANRVGSPAKLYPGNAGIPIYPAHNAVTRSYKARPKERRVFLSPFLWTPNEASIIFFERANDGYHLVRIDLTSMPEGPPRIARREVPRHEVVEPGTVDPLVVADGIRMRGESHVILRFHTAPGIRESLELALP